MLYGLKRRLWKVMRWAWRYPVWDKRPLPTSASFARQALAQDLRNEHRLWALPPLPRVRPLTEGYVVKGGTNSSPSQITDRPPPPAPMTRPGTRCPECGR